MKHYDKVDELILLKRMGINSPVPDELKDEVDRRWEEYEKGRFEIKRINFLLDKPFSVEKYKIATLQHEATEYVLYADYEFVVKHLQEKISRLHSENSHYRYDSSTSWRD